MLIEKLLDLIFIPNGRCPICYRVIFFSDHFICEQCESQLELTVEKRCKKCGKEIRDEINYCSDCITHQYHFEEGFALYNYEGSVKMLIHKIKFSNCPELGTYLGSYLGEGLKKCIWLKEIDFIIPVPLHENRLKSRGYNQSEKISRGILSSFVDYKSLSYIEINKYILARRKDTVHQLELSKEDRFKNVKNAFMVMEKSQIKDKIILLVDDVYTTGATIEACSSELIENGAKKVYFAVLASGKMKIV